MSSSPFPIYGPTPVRIPIAPEAILARVDHLKALEAESIYILREAAAEFARPVMLYSIGKDSSVMLRLAQKAFYPRQDSVSAAAYRYQLQVSEMIEFRDSYAREIGAELIVHTNQEGDSAKARIHCAGHSEVLRLAENASAARCARGRRI